MASSVSESESESEEKVRYPSDEPKGKMSEYEKQRFSRIAENKARLEALGISKAAKAIMGSSKRRGKPNSDEKVLLPAPIIAQSSESESEEKVRYPSDEPKGKMSEYEKQRFSRIAENKARLEALGISKAAKAIMGSRKLRGKPNSDDDYRPGEADGDEDSEYDEEGEEFLGNSSSVSRKTKSKKRQVVLSLNRSDPMGEDDDLKKAIALSLQDSEAAAAAAGGGSRESPGKKRRNDQEAARWKKKKPELMMSKMQMTEDEFVIYFYQFDEAGKGFITLRDVAKMATVHDFTWTDEELQDMIRCFDMDKDGKLSLDEFKKIVTRCRMLKES